LNINHFSAYVLALVKSYLPSHPPKSIKVLKSANQGRTQGGRGLSGCSSPNRN